MSELRRVLERVGGRVTPRADAFDRLERGRRRRERNRRIATGVVAFLVAIAGSIGLFEAFRGSDRGTPVGESEGFHALWPEQTLAEAEAVQDRVDSGEASMQWRLEADLTAERFAHEVLLWSDAVVGVALPGPAPAADVMTIQVSKPPAPCPSPPEPGCLPRSAVLTLERLVRPDATGIWSVTEVRSPDLSMPLLPGQDVSAGSTIEIHTTLEDGLEVSVGVAYLVACDAHPEEVTLRVQDHKLVYQVPTVPDGCAGYVYAMTPSTGEGAVAIGSFLLTDAGPVPSIGYTVTAIAAVPVRFVNATKSPVAAQIVCDGSTTQVLTREVAAQPDGVHVRVTNTSSTDLTIDFGEAGGDNAPIGTHDVVGSFFPGQVRVGCWDPTVEREPFLDGSFTVVDPNGYFVPSMIDCGGGEAVTGYPDYVEGAAGWTGDPVDIARKHANGLLPTDEVSYAGYPEQAQPQVRVVRDGAVVAVFGFFDDGQGGWLMSSYQACSAASIGGVEAAPQPVYPRGAFERCPDLEGMLSPGPNAGQEASSVALRFARAFVSGDDATVAALEDLSVPKDASWRVVGTPDGISVGGGGPYDPGNIVAYGCGPQVASKTWAVTFDDGTSSASADFTLFLVLRADGWKVWGSY